MTLGITMGLGVEIKGSAISFIAIILLGIFAFIALGSMISGFIKSEKTADVVGMLLAILFFFPAFMPPQAFSESVRLILRILPSVPLANVLRDLIMGCGTLATNLNNIGVILVWLGVCGVIAAATFKWE